MDYTIQLFLFFFENGTRPQPSAWAFCIRCRCQPYPMKHPTGSLNQQLS